MAHQRNKKYGNDIGYDKTVVYAKLSTCECMLLLSYYHQTVKYVDHVLTRFKVFNLAAISTTTKKKWYLG